MDAYRRLIEQEKQQQARDQAAAGVKQAADINGSKAAKLVAGQVAGQLQQTDSGFRYDPDQDPIVSAYRKMYKREGERATADTMAKAASMTGGVPSSYAVTAASQAGDYYASKMADKLPELEQNAYQRYISAEADRYNREQDAKNWQWQQDQFAYQKEQDAQTLQLQKDQIAYNQQQDALAAAEAQKNTAWDKAMTRFELMGYADKEVAAVLGIPEGTKANAAITGGGNNPVNVGVEATPSNSTKSFIRQVMDRYDWSVANGKKAQTDANILKSTLSAVAAGRWTAGEGKYVADTFGLTERDILAYINEAVSAGSMSSQDAINCIDDFGLWDFIEG